MKKIAVLGSTGSIGVNTLLTARHLKDKIKVVALAAHTNIDLLEQQAKEFYPEMIAVFDKTKASELQKRLPYLPVLAGMEGLQAVAACQKADMIISAMTGTLGLIPTITAIKAGKDVGLANKEALVSGGALVMKLVKEYGVNLLPIDSEHSAIFQCLQGQKKESIKRLIITASGGPFRLFSPEQLTSVTVDQALRHPTWQMGPKITVDCSTLMNKGLEVIEAHWLFNIPINQIDVVIHPQSIIHSMVEFVDHSILAQMGEPNMQLPIQYAMTYPKRVESLQAPFDFTKMHQMQFFPPDFKQFKCLSLAYDSVKQGGSTPCYMNAANEVLVNRCLKKEISWIEIGQKLEKLMEQHTCVKINDIDDVLNIDALAREHAKY